MGERSTLRWGSSAFLFLVVVGLTACGAVSAAPIDAGPVDAAPPHCPVCDPNATCQGVTCACGPGWEGNGETCADVDECLTANGGCDLNADCANSEGSRDCSCKTGFVGDGLACQPVWIRVGSFAGVDINPEGFGAKAAGVGNLILFGFDGNAPFMRSFDITTQSLSNPLALPTGSNDFCACGFTDVFLGGGPDLYMLGNNGVRYKPENNVWTTVAGYVDPFRRGEAAGAFDPTNAAIYLVGGRDHENTALRMSAQQAFSALPGTVPFNVNEGKAWVFSGDNHLYVTSGNDSQLAVLGITAGSDTSWSTLPAAPASLRQPIGMGEFQSRVWVATTTGLQFFDPGPKQWTGSVAAPMGIQVAVVAAGNTYALCKTVNGLEIYQLNAIE